MRFMADDESVAFLENTGVERECEDKSPEKGASSPEFKDPVLDNICRGCRKLRTGDRSRCEKCGTPYFDNLLEDSDEEPKIQTTPVRLLIDHLAKKDNIDEAEHHPQNLLPLTIDPVSVRPAALPLNATWKDESNLEWTLIRTVVDSGAAESVGPPSMTSTVPAFESPGSVRGQAYIAAAGERIPNLGQQTLDVVTNEGCPTQVVYQIAEFTRPLTAVGTTCDKRQSSCVRPARRVHLQHGVWNPYTLHPAWRHL